MLLWMLVAWAFLAGTWKKAEAAEAPRMTKEELKTRISAAADLLIIDVRAAKDWADSDQKITGAVREDPKTPEKWAGKYPKEKTLVLYCA